MNEMKKLQGEMLEKKETCKTLNRYEKNKDKDKKDIKRS